MSDAKFWERVVTYARPAAIEWKKQQGIKWAKSERGLGYLAHLSGRPESTLRSWVVRGVPVPREDVRIWSEALGVSEAWLLTGASFSTSGRPELERLVYIAEQLDKETVEALCAMAEKMVKN